MKTLTSKYQLISRDELDTCANYARLINGKVEIETLYRYGKPVSRMVSVSEFNRMQENNEV